MQNSTKFAHEKLLVLQPRYGPERQSITHVLTVVHLVNQVQEIIPATNNKSADVFLLFFADNYHGKLE